MKKLCDKECWKCDLDECVQPWLYWDEWKWWQFYDRLYNSKKI